MLKGSSVSRLGLLYLDTGKGKSVTPTSARPATGESKINVLSVQPLVLSLSQCLLLKFNMTTQVKCESIVL
jgi:hypothetical protein